MHKYGFRDWDSVLAAIGHGGLKEGQVFNKLVEAYEREHKKNLTDEQVLEAASESQEKLHIAKSKSGIVVKGIHDVAVRFSKCCSPIPGDEIVGFVTRGRGITIHRTDCVNVLNMPEIDRKRLIEAEWQMPDKAGFREIRSRDPGLRKQPYRTSGGYFQDLYRAEDRSSFHQQPYQQAGTCDDFHVL